MVAITATNSTTPSVQASLGRARLEQARRDADQAEANAKDLRAQADKAESQAQQSQSKFSKVSAEVRSDETTYSPSRGTGNVEVPLQAQSVLGQSSNTTSEKRTDLAAALNTSPSAAPTVKVSGAQIGSNAIATYPRPGTTNDAEVPLKVQSLIEQLYSATSETRALSGNVLKASPNALPVVNIQGQQTGRILNISA
jgi:hypothetical protein